MEFSFLIRSLKNAQRRMEIRNFDQLFSLDSYLFKLSSNFTEMMTIENYRLGLSDCERTISVQEMMNVSEHHKYPNPVERCRTKIARVNGTLERGLKMYIYRNQLLQG